MRLHLEVISTRGEGHPAYRTLDVDTDGLERELAVQVGFGARRIRVRADGTDTWHTAYGA